MKHNAAQTGPRDGSGFTLVEMLVVIMIIALLVSIALVALSRAMESSRKAATTQYLSNLAFALESYKNDFNDYPPLLNGHSELESESQEIARMTDRATRLTVADGLGVNSSGEIERREGELVEARFRSKYSLAAYLVGVGDVNGDGMEDAKDDGVEGPGLRDPGRDRSWGGALSREDSDHKPPAGGRAYGPYFDVGSGRNFGRTTTRSGNRITDDADPRRSLYVFTDRWDNPIYYYRLWPVQDADNPQRKSLDRVPIELLRADTIRNKQEGRALDAATDREILNAPFALVSSGPDGLLASMDGEDVNRDGQMEPPCPLPLSRIDATFRNSLMLDQLLSNDEAYKVKALAESMIDNSRVTP